MGGGVNVIMTQPIGLPILQFDVQIYFFFRCPNRYKNVCNLYYSFLPVPLERQTCLHDFPASPFTVTKAFTGGQLLWLQKFYQNKQRHRRKEKNTD